MKEMLVKLQNHPDDTSSTRRNVQTQHYIAIADNGDNCDSDPSLSKYVRNILARVSV